MNLTYYFLKVNLGISLSLFLKKKRMLKYITKSSLQTKKIGEKLAKKILREGPKKNYAQVLALSGELGGGKTTFLQGFAKGLSVKKRILSPTFVIMKSFKLGHPSFDNFYHFDCYRIKKATELFVLGFDKILSNPKNIVAIEWAERVQKLLSKDTRLITFKLYNKKERKIVIR